MGQWGSSEIFGVFGNTGKKQKTASASRTKKDSSLNLIPFFKGAKFGKYGTSRLKSQIFQSHRFPRFDLDQAPASTDPEDTEDVHHGDGKCASVRER